MEEHLKFECSQHADAYECPDTLVSYSQQFDEYGVIVHDGGSSSIVIKYCPWCGTKLPESKREGPPLSCQEAGSCGGSK
jgi:hypothetical protein